MDMNLIDNEEPTVKRNPIDNQEPTVKRQLKARHMTMIAIGGSIGTGLFLASGANHPERRARRCPRCLCLHWDHGLFPDDELRGNGDIYACVGILFHLCHTLC